MLGNWRRSWSPVFILCSPSAVFIALTGVDPGEGPRGAQAIPLFLDQTEARRSDFFFRPAPPYLRAWMTAPPSPRLIWRSGSTTD